jgi:ABC-type multidrug transport system permease subunit
MLIVQQKRSPSKFSFAGVNQAEQIFTPPSQRSQMVDMVDSPKSERREEESEHDLDLISPPRKFRALGLKQTEEKEVEGEDLVLEKIVEDGSTRIFAVPAALATKLRFFFCSFFFFFFSREKAGLNRPMVFAFFISDGARISERFWETIWGSEKRSKWFRFSLRCVRIALVDFSSSVLLRAQINGLTSSRSGALFVLLCSTEHRQQRKPQLQT